MITEFIYDFGGLFHMMTCRSQSKIANKMDLTRNSFLLGSDKIRNLEPQEVQSNTMSALNCAPTVILS